MDDEHPNPGFVGGDFLDQCFGLAGFLPGGDAGGAFDPGAGGGLDIVEHLAAAAAIAPDDVAMTTAAQLLEIGGSDHAAIADKHGALDAEATFQILHHIGHRLGVALVACEHMMRDRPAIDQHQADQHLRVAWLLVAAVAVRTDLVGPAALEVGRSEIVKHHIRLQREQIAQAQIQIALDALLVLEQLIERAIPLLELTHLDLHARCAAGLACHLVAPLCHPSPAMTITDEVALQPARQPMLAAGRSKPIEHQHEGAVTERVAIAPARKAEPIEHRLQPELTPQMAGGQRRPPVPGGQRRDVIGLDRARGPLRRGRITVQQPRQLVEIEMLGQHIAAAEIENGAMAGLTVLSNGFDDPHILVLDTLTAGGANDAEEHRGTCWNLSRRR
jgi:hypothetical protein